MRYVLDSSVALKWVLPEADSAKAIRLRDEYSNGLHELLAPDIFPSEIANGLVSAERQKRIRTGKSAIFLNDILSAAPTLHHSSPLLIRAMEIAISTTQAVYDCIYLALAEAEGREWVTADDQFARRLRTSYPFRDERGRIIPPGTLGKYYELRNEQGSWQPIRPGDVRPYEPIDASASPFKAGVPELIEAGLAKGQSVYLLRTARGGSRLSPAIPVPDRTDVQGNFSAQLLMPTNFPWAELPFASSDFSRQAIHVVRIDDPDRPLEITLLPAREVRARVIETPEDHPEEELNYDIYSIDPAHASLYDSPEIGTKGALWRNSFLKKAIDGRSPVERRRLETRLPAGRYRISFRSDTVYDVVDLVVPPGESPLDLPDISIKTLAWVPMLGKPAAEIESVDLEGKPAQLADYRGKLVVLAFWSSKGNSTIRRFPHLARIQERFKDQALAFLAIHDASVTSLASFKQALEPIRKQIIGENSIRLLLDRAPVGGGRIASPLAGEVGSGRTADAYDAPTPSTFVIDKTGKLVSAVLDNPPSVAAFTIDKRGKLIRDEYEVADVVGEADFRTVMSSALQGVLEDQLGLPRSSRPSPKVKAEMPLPKGPLVIKGKVVDLEGRPVPGAQVQYVRVPTEKTVKTGPTGDFTFTLDKVVRYGHQIRVIATGLATKGLVLSFRSRDMRPDPDSRTVSVEPSGLISQPVRLSPGAGVTGRLLRDGRPVVGVAIGLQYAEVTSINFDQAIECKTDERGSFRFPHVLPESDLWAFVKLGSLANQGAVIPQRLHIQEEGSTLDLGVLTVQKGRKLAGRLVCSDGLVLPRGSTLVATVPDAGGMLLTISDERQRFEFTGIPDGPVHLMLDPRKGSSTRGYHFSPKNACLNPTWPSRLEGQVNHDITDLTILLEPGEPDDFSRNPAAVDPTVLADFNDAEAEPITGVPPAEYPPK